MYLNAARIAAGHAAVTFARKVWEERDENIMSAMREALGNDEWRDARDTAKIAIHKTLGIPQFFENFWRTATAAADAIRNAAGDDLDYNQTLTVAVHAAMAVRSVAWNDEADVDNDFYNDVDNLFSSNSESSNIIGRDANDAAVDWITSVTSSSISVSRGELGAKAYPLIVLYVLAWMVGENGDPYVFAAYIGAWDYFGYSDNVIPKYSILKVIPKYKKFLVKNRPENSLEQGLTENPFTMNLLRLADEKFIRVKMNLITIRSAQETTRGLLSPLRKLPRKLAQEVARMVLPVAAEKTISD